MRYGADEFAVSQNRRGVSVAAALGFCAGLRGAVLATVFKNRALLPSWDASGCVRQESFGGARTITDAKSGERRDRCPGVEIDQICGAVLAQPSGSPPFQIGHAIYARRSARRSDPTVNLSRQAGGAGLGTEPRRWKTKGG